MHAAFRHLDVAPRKDGQQCFAPSGKKLSMDLGSSVWCRRVEMQQLGTAICSWLPGA